MADLITREDLQQLFDLATHSLNFGSGFLDTEEVELLRKVATGLGVDPMLGTPDNFAANYPHAFKPAKHNVEVCEWSCNRSAASSLHGGGEVEEQVDAATLKAGDVIRTWRGEEIVVFAGPDTKRYDNVPVILVHTEFTVKGGHPHEYGGPERETATLIVRDHMADLERKAEEA